MIIVILGCLMIASVQSVSAQNWPQWRGPLATGEALSGNPPIEWSEQLEKRSRTKQETIRETGSQLPLLRTENMFMPSSDLEDFTATRSREN